MGFLNIVRNSLLFNDVHCQGPFPFNHRNMGTQNHPVDEEFNIIAAIDWEFAQSAPVSANYFSIPFPLGIVGDSDEAVLADPDHLANENLSKRTATRDPYLRKLEEAEKSLANQGNPTPCSIATALSQKASEPLYTTDKFTRSESEGLEKEVILRMWKLGYWLGGIRAEQHVDKMSEEMNISI